MKRLTLVLLCALLIAGCAGNTDPQQTTTTSTPPESSPSANNAEQTTPGTPLPDSINVKALNQPADARSAYSDYTPQDSGAYRVAADKLSRAMLTGNGNAAITPVSLYIALSMLAQGAEGETATQLCSLLGMEHGELAEFNSLLIPWLNASGYMSTVNSVWVQPGFPVQDTYLKTMAEQYYAFVNELDFSQPEASATIAGWISDNTKGLLQPGFELSPDTMMALANATLLMDEWQDSFDAGLTDQQDFAAPSGNAKVDMMHTNRSVTQWLGDGYRAISLPLKNAGSMVFVLPDEGTSPAELLAREGSGRPTLTELCNLDNENETHHLEIDISIPKFDISSQTSAKEVLNTLGITDVFDDGKADLSGISDEALWADDVLHGTRVMVHEDGVAAAGFTMIAMAGAALPEPGDPFVLDRPFLFCIEKQGMPLFVGTVAQPNEPGSVKAPEAKLIKGIPEPEYMNLETRVEEFFKLYYEYNDRATNFSGPIDVEKELTTGSSIAADMNQYTYTEKMTQHFEITELMKVLRMKRDPGLAPYTGDYKLELQSAEKNSEGKYEVKVFIQRGTEEQLTYTLVMDNQSGLWAIDDIKWPQSKDPLLSIENEYVKLRDEFTEGKDMWEMDDLKEYVIAGFLK